MEKIMNRICVAERESNGYHDSYFYATYWIPGTKSFKEEMIGSTAFAGGMYHEVINADDTVKRMYQEWLESEASVKEASIPRVGKTAIIINSRKYKEPGKIDFVGQSFYDTRETVARLRFSDNTTSYVSVKRLKVLAITA
jgi:hypothetical protein